MFLIDVIITAGIGVFSWYVSNIGMEYSNLIKPNFTPSPFIFIAVSLVIYVLIALSAYFVRTSKHKGKYEALNIYRSQLILYYTLMPIFFALQFRLISMIWLIISIYLTFKTISLFDKINKKSGFLMIPYFLWLLYLFYLNVGFYFCNRGF